MTDNDDDKDKDDDQQQGETPIEPQRRILGDAPLSWPENWPVPKVTNDDIAIVLADEARRIIIVQETLVREGARKLPSLEMLKHCICLHRASAFISRAAPHARDIKDLIARAERKGDRR